MAIKCPKCGRRLDQAGEATVGEQTFPVYQCDECLVVTDFAGEKLELAYTFALDAQGRPFDPAAPDDSLPQ